MAVVDGRMVGPILSLGVLYKLGQFWKRWRARTFMLTPQTLYYFVKWPSPRSRGKIPLSHILTVTKDTRRGRIWCVGRRCAGNAASCPRRAHRTWCVKPAALPRPRVIGALSARARRRVPCGVPRRAVLRGLALHCRPLPVVHSPCVCAWIPAQHVCGDHEATVLPVTVARQRRGSVDSVPVPRQPRLPS